MKRILSIDWDYFFPCDESYDWGHQESPFFINMIWSMRTANKTYDDKLIMDVHRPMIPRGFWDKVLTNQPVLFVAESHCELWPTIDAFCGFHGPVEVVNLDAHHDCGYGKHPEQVPDTFSIECGDWGFWGLKTGRIAKLQQHYPAWRKRRPEGEPEVSSTSVSFELPVAARYDAVFICRSGAWTPPWYDHRLEHLIKSSGLEQTEELAPRGPSLKEARQMSAFNLAAMNDAMTAFEMTREKK